MQIAELSLDKRAEGVVVMDLRGLSSITDYFVICSGASDTQVKAIADHIEDELQKQRVKPWHREGYSNLQWVILDYVDVVVHVFLPEVREFYSLERLWGDAETTEVTDDQPSNSKEQ
jgi:ribosome-associated protein